MVSGVEEPVSGDLYPPVSDPVARTEPQQHWGLDAATWLLGVAAFNSFLPLVLKTLLAPKYRPSVGDDVINSPIASLVQQLTGFALVATCIVIFARRASNLPRSGRITLFVMLAPWIYMLGRDFYLGRKPGVPALLYGVVVLAVWALQPRLDRLRAAAWLAVTAVVVSLLLGLLLPAKGVLAHQNGDLVTPEKQIIPWGILVGVFTGGNQLALFLVTGMASLVFLKNRFSRILLIAVTIFALLWTSARAEIIGAVVVILVLVVFAIVRPVIRPPIALIVLSVSFGLMFWAPLSHPTDQAFTNRGYIWRISFGYWQQMELIGGGTTWYNKVSAIVNPFPATAFNGHNTFVHTLVTGGLIAAIPLIWLFLIVIVRAIMWSARGSSYPAAFLGGLFVCCMTEVSFGFTDRGPMLATVVVPLAFIAFSPMPPLPGPQPAEPAVLERLARESRRRSDTSEW